VTGRIPERAPGDSAPAAIQIDSLLRAVAAANRPQSRSLPLAEGRRNFLELMSPLAAHEHVADVEERVIPGPRGELGLRVYRNSGTELHPATLFFHGGGWVFGGLESHDPMCRALARESDTVVVAVDYGLAPEHRFPEPLDDCLAATRWVADHGADLGIDSALITVAGDSAGGNLATAVALRARDEGGPPISFQLLAYPALTPAPSAAPRDTAACDPFLTREEMDWFWARYLGDTGVSSPYAAPADAADLSGLPPACLVLAGIDPLLDEGIAYGEELLRAGVSVDVVVYEEMVHGFLLFTEYLDDARRALREAGLAIRQAMAHAPSASAVTPR